MLEHMNAPFNPLTFGYRGKKETTIQSRLSQTPSIHTASVYRLFSYG